MSHALSHTWSLTLSRMRLAMRNRAFFFFSLIMPLAFLFGYAELFRRLGPAAMLYVLPMVLALTVMGNNAMLTGWPAAVLVVVSFTALLLTAIVANRRAVKAAASTAAPLVTLPPAKQQG